MRKTSIVHMSCLYFTNFITNHKYIQISTAQFTVYFWLALAPSPDILLVPTGTRWYPAFWKVYSIQCTSCSTTPIHPCAHSAEKLCPLNRLQTQPYTTKWCLNLNQPPCYKMPWGFLWCIKSQCRSLQNDFTKPFCSENGLQWKIMIRY